MDHEMRIGEIAEQAGVTQRTIRYYESLGLLTPGKREGHGHHYYNEETVVRLRKIDQLKRLGLSLEEISQVIDLYFTEQTEVHPKQKVLEILRKHLQETEDKIGDLEQFRSELQANIDRFEKYLDMVQQS